MTDNCKVIEVSRRIEAPAARIFEVLIDPRRHTEIDGSGMLRGTDAKENITGVGGIFTMEMHLEALGGYHMINYVVEFERDRCIAWEPAAGDAAASQDGAFPIGDPPGHRWSFDLMPEGNNTTVVTERYDCTAGPENLRVAVQNGEVWIDSMTSTLARLDACVVPTG
jgi:hypothetical protein